MNLKFLSLLSVVIAFACQTGDEDPTDPAIPVVTTTAASAISDTFASSGGNVTGDGGSAVTARGVCWSKTSGPTVSGSKTINGSGNGSFSSLLSGLLPNTTYYIRAYATNAVGTGYGNEVSFTTNICPATVTDIDGNVYEVIQAGGECWMKQNLKTARYRDGSAIPTGLNSSQWGGTTNGAYCYYNDDPANNTTHGKLYNWFAVNTGKLAPAGWHVASYDEYTALFNAYGGITAAANALKSTATWDTPNTNTNTSGFSATGCGYRGWAGPYSSKGAIAEIWSSTVATLQPNSAFMVGLIYNQAFIAGGPVFKQEGCAVRCVKD